VVDALLNYVEEQLAKGYTSEAIKTTLIRQGYSPAMVDGVLESVSMNKSSGGEVSLGANHEKSALPKLALILVFLFIVVGGAFIIPDMLKPKEALLDVKTMNYKLSYNAGDELGFDVELNNMGSAERFDVAMICRLLDSNDNTILSKEDTFAVSTSLSRHWSIPLPNSLQPGKYLMKVFANYDGKVAAASFSFDVQEKVIVAESCTDGKKNQDETAIDCGGVCTASKGAYWYDNACHFNPKTGPVTQETCSDGKKNQDETAVDCGGACTGVNGAYWYDDACHFNPKPQVIVETKPTFTDLMIKARAAAATNPEEAKSICLGMEATSEQDSCLKEVAALTKLQEYCELITSVTERDRCYIPFYFQYKDYTVCEKLTDPESKQACEQLREIDQITKKFDEGNEQEAAQMVANSSTFDYFSD
jgi:hypothetical protein